MRAAEPIAPEHLEFFESRVRPVLVEHCYQCHSAEAGEKLKSGLRLDTREGIRKGGESGVPAVVPKDVHRSRLIEAIRWSNPDLQMPPKQKLSDRQIADLVTWVDLGAPDPREGQATPLPARRNDGGAAFWSFVAPKEPPVPPVRNESWARNPIDRFVLAKLDEKNLKPSAPADARTMIRRATFDLHGLPPTAEEVDAFVADTSPDAYERLIERLLSSPRYGERWGRYWLDLARYSDTKGYVYEGREDRRFVHSHAYRDWVIRAFNDDKPYDRFLLEQIAADQLDYPSTRARQQALPAMGFLTVGRRFLGVVPDIVDDRIDVLTRTTQGLTVACARCHDHKFDPIPTQDYYSLYGVLVASTERIVPVDLDPARTPQYAKYKAGLDEREKKLNEVFAARCVELEGRLRAQTTQYLVAALDADKLPPDVFYEILSSTDVIPAVVRQWDQYINRTSRGGFDPVFAPWHALVALPADNFAAAAPGVIERLKSDPTRKPNALVTDALLAAKPASMKDVARVYGELFVATDTAWRIIDKVVPKATRFPEPDREALRQVLYGPGTPARVPSGSIQDVDWFFDEPARIEMGKHRKELEGWHIATAGAPAQAVVLEDRPGEQRLPRVFKRGNPSTPGEEVPRQYLAVASGKSREPFRHGSGRLELAQAVASKHNPLTARVMVNRIWQNHFGVGLVSTPSDFGARSEPPSHPELLDWLALRFIDQGWSVKQMHRLIMTSATYRQSSSDANPAAAAVDPENKLLWRMNRTRLDFESLRDSLLAATGGLDPAAGGPPADVLSNRRSVYLFVDRQFLPGMFRTFDFASPDLHIPRRAETTVPQQALFFLNGKLVADRARAMAKSETITAAPSDADRVRRIYRALFQREPSSTQVADAIAFVNDPTVQPEPPKPVPVTPWQYGYGEYDSSSDRMKSFTALPHYNGDAWQGGPNWPDPALGWVQLTANGGHAGNDLAHAAVRRWVAPRDMTVRIQSTVFHRIDAGDGINARIVSSTRGTLGQWRLKNGEGKAKVERIEVKQGDTLDFVVDLSDNLNNDMFEWSPNVHAVDPPAGTELPIRWSAYEQFTGPLVPKEPMDPWAMYVQVLLLSNEFVFVD